MAGLLGVVDILVRAGGGQGFGGGGAGGGGGGIGGGGGGGFPLFFFGGGALAEGGSILVALLVVGGVVLLVASRVRSGAVRDRDIVEHPYTHTDGPAYAPGTVPVVEGGAVVTEQRPAPVAAGLDAIRAHDPAFDLDTFKASIERSFFIVEEAWTDLKPEMSRRVMADGIWQQHRAQMEQYERNGTRNALDGLAVGKVTIVSASTDQQHDTITTRILATCADYDVDKSGHVVRGDKHTMTPFQEDWVFQRSSSAKTPAAGGTLEQRCPNCGAPLDLDLAGVCHYCHQPVMSGQYDWVLTRIDQV